MPDGELVFPAGAIGELDALLLSFVPRLAGADEPLTGFGKEEDFFVERRCGSLQFEEEDEFGEHGWWGDMRHAVVYHLFGTSSMSRS